MSTKTTNTGRGGLVSHFRRRNFSRRAAAIGVACLLAISLGASPQAPLGSPAPGGILGGAGRQRRSSRFRWSSPGAGGGPHRPAPTDTYFSHFAYLYDGDYAEALRAFNSDLGSSIKSSESRWIDSICYYTMIGECYYHLGQYNDGAADELRSGPAAVHGVSQLDAATAISRPVAAGCADGDASLGT